MKTLNFNNVYNQLTVVHNTRKTKQCKNIIVMILKATGADIFGHSGHFNVDIQSIMQYSIFNTIIYIEEYQNLLLK